MKIILRPTVNLKPIDKDFPTLDEVPQLNSILVNSRGFQLRVSNIIYKHNRNSGGDLLYPPVIVVVELREPLEFDSASDWQEWYDKV